MRIVPDAIPRNVRHGDVARSLAVVLKPEVSAAGALRQHVLEYQAAEQRERVVVRDVAQALRRRVGAVFLGRRAGECLGVGARLALHAAEQLQLILDLVDRNDRLAALLQYLAFVPGVLVVVNVVAVALRQADLVYARQLALLEPADQPGVEVVEVAGVRIGIAARQVTDRRRRVGAAVAGMDMEMDGGVAHWLGCCCWVAAAAAPPPAIRPARPYLRRMSIVLASNTT